MNRRGPARGVWERRGAGKPCLCGAGAAEHSGAGVIPLRAGRGGAWWGPPVWPLKLAAGPRCVNAALWDASTVFTQIEGSCECQLGLY